MKLIIAGGCGEHGRNCFWVKKGRHTWIVDCGLAEADTERYPKLSKKKIREAKYLFLTHSHKDHTGAIPWLIEMGFTGEIVASRNTFQQLPFGIDRKLVLEEICPGGKGRVGGLRVKWGRSGHCPGSVWYQFKAGGKRILFSGDYTEHTTVYGTDLLRDKMRQSYPVLFLPVPRYGRGLELLKLLQEKFPNDSFYGDSHFIRQLENLEKNVEWYQDSEVRFKEAQLYSDRVERGFVFLSDPQLNSPETQEMAGRILKKGGYCILTGTVEKESYSEKLLQQEKASLFSYPVHLNASQYQKLIRKNRFRRAIPFHSAEFPCEKEYEI